ncbi:putative brevis radix (BRX) domain, protein BREVIS RADIX [Helianthus annuus]|nr:putative brevis radix (BRX) domain, protein BREVIS RADIX [Helianthus annuus]
MFNKWQAQRWWQENFDKVMELYNVRRLNRQAFPLPIPPKSEDELPLNSRVCYHHFTFIKHNTHNFPT